MPRGSGLRGGRCLSQSNYWATKSGLLKDFHTSLPAISLITMCILADVNWYPRSFAPANVMAVWTLAGGFVSSLSVCPKVGFYGGVSWKTTCGSAGPGLVSGSHRSIRRVWLSDYPTPINDKGKDGGRRTREEEDFFSGWFFPALPPPSLPLSGEAGIHDLEIRRLNHARGRKPQVLRQATWAMGPFVCIVHTKVSDADRFSRSHGLHECPRRRADVSRRPFLKRQTRLIHTLCKRNISSGCSSWSSLIYIFAPPPLSLCWHPWLIDVFRRFVYCTFNDVSSKGAIHLFYYRCHPFSSPHLPAVFFFILRVCVDWFSQFWSWLVLQWH